MKKIKNYINGSNICYSNAYADLFDPSTGEKSGNVVLSNEKDFNEVLKSSKKAFNEWSNTTPLKRSRVISKYKNLIEKNIDELANCII